MTLRFCMSCCLQSGHSSASRLYIILTLSLYEFSSAFTVSLFIILEWTTPDRARIAKRCTNFILIFSQALNAITLNLNSSLLSHEPRGLIRMALAILSSLY